MTADLDSAPQNCTPRQLASRCVNVRNQEPRQGAPRWIATVAVFDFPRRSESLPAILRFGIIALGLQVIAIFRPVLLILAGVLLWSAFKMVNWDDPLTQAAQYRA